MGHHWRACKLQVSPKIEGGGVRGPLSGFLWDTRVQIGVFMKLMREQPGIWVDGVQIKGNQSCGLHVASFYIYMLKAIFSTLCWWTAIICSYFPAVDV